MSFPAIRSSSGGSQDSNATTHTVTLPATISPGDLLIVIMGFDQNPTVTWDQSSHGTWSQLLSQSDGSNQCKLVVYAKTASGSEDGGTLSISTGNTEQSCFRCYAIQDWHGTTAAEIASATGLSTTPNPPSLSPSWGAADTLFLALHVHDRGDRPVSAFPSSYTNTYSDNSATDSSGCGIGVCTRALNSSSEDPGTFTIPSSDDWVAATIAVRPSSGGLTGAASSISDEATQAAAGSLKVSGGAIQTADESAQAASGSVKVSGSAASAIDEASQSASGLVSNRGSAQQESERPSQSAAGNLKVIGQSSQSAERSSQTADGEVTVTGTAQSSGERTSQGASGSVGSPGIAGVGDSEATAPIQEAEGVIRTTGEIRSEASEPGQFLQSVLTVAGSAPQVAEKPIQSASGRLIARGIAALRSRRASQISSGKLSHRGTAVNRGERARQSASGVISGVITSFPVDINTTKEVSAANRSTNDVSENTSIDAGYDRSSESVCYDGVTVE